MVYSDGRVVMLGDRVNLAPVVFPARTDLQWIGTVLCVFDTHAFTPGYEDWDSLTEGCFVRCDAAGLIHYTSPTHDFEFLSRFDGTV